MDAKLSLYPSTLKVDASMGSLQVTDPRLPSDHPYHWIVRPAAGAEHAGQGVIEKKHSTDVESTSRVCESV